MRTRPRGSRRRQPPLRREIVPDIASETLYARQGVAEETAWVSPVDWPTGG
jgi:hypothetical protein